MQIIVGIVVVLLVAALAAAQHGDVGVGRYVIFMIVGTVGLVVGLWFLASWVNG